jgi:hypothetical protein
VEKKILPIPETTQGISTSAESKEETSKKKLTLQLTKMNHDLQGITIDFDFD